MSQSFTAAHTCTLSKDKHLYGFYNANVLRAEETRGMTLCEQFSISQDQHSVSNGQIWGQCSHTSRSFVSSDRCSN